MKYYCLVLSGYGPTPLRTRKNKSEVLAVMAKYGIQFSAVRRCGYDEGKTWHINIFGA